MGSESIESILFHPVIQQLFIEHHVCSKDLGYIIKQNTQKKKKIPALLGTFYLGKTDEKKNNKSHESVNYIICKKVFSALERLDWSMEIRNVEWTMKTNFK